MSYPIATCMISKAAKGDENTQLRIESRAKYNLTQPAFSIWPCNHEPKCPIPTDLEMQLLLEKSPYLLALLARLP